MLTNVSLSVSFQHLTTTPNRLVLSSIAEATSQFHSRISSVIYTQFDSILFHCTRFNASAEKSMRNEEKIEQFSSWQNREKTATTTTTIQIVCILWTLISIVLPWNWSNIASDMDWTLFGICSHEECDWSKAIRVKDESSQVKSSQTEPMKWSTQNWSWSLYITVSECTHSSCDWASTFTSRSLCERHPLWHSV